MMDYDWTTDNRDREVITDEIRNRAYSEIEDYCTDEGGVQFTRDALIVVGRK